MNRIFVSYRRAENQYAAGALARDLRRRYGDLRVFRDREDISGGVAWKERVLGEISKGTALLVLMGKDWAQMMDGQGRRRLDLPEDPVRLEIADGLRDGAIVVPILLEDAAMPEARDLPEDIRDIAGLNALRLRDGDWHHDLDSIGKALKQRGFKRGAVEWRRKHLGVSWFINCCALLILLAPENRTSESATAGIYWCTGALMLALFAWRDHRTTPRKKWWALSAVGLAATLLLIYTLLAFT